MASTVRLSVISEYIRSVSRCVRLDLIAVTCGALALARWGGESVRSPRENVVTQKQKGLTWVEGCGRVVERGWGVGCASVRYGDA